MAKITIFVNQADDTVKASCDLNGASLADLTIMERLLRRSLVQVIEEGNNLLDKDTKGKKAKNAIFEDME